MINWHLRLLVLLSCNASYTIITRINIEFSMRIISLFYHNISVYILDIVFTILAKFHVLPLAWLTKSIFVDLEFIWVLGTINPTVIQRWNIKMRIIRQTSNGRWISLAAPNVKNMNNNICIYSNLDEWRFFTGKDIDQLSTFLSGLMIP